MIAKYTYLFNARSYWTECSSPRYLLPSTSILIANPRICLHLPESVISNRTLMSSMVQSINPQMNTNYEHVINRDRKRHAMIVSGFSIQTRTNRANTRTLQSMFAWSSTSFSVTHHTLPLIFSQRKQWPYLVGRVANQKNRKAVVICNVTYLSTGELAWV